MTGLIPNDAVAIGVGAVLGATARYHGGRLCTDYIVAATADPKKNAAFLQNLTGWHTAAINIAGSFLLGGISAAPVQSSKLKRIGLTPRLKLMLGVGFCGSFTTFSTYSVDVVNWIAANQGSKAALYILTNNVGGICAASLGMMMVKKLF